MNKYTAAIIAIVLLFIGGISFKSIQKTTNTVITEPEEDSSQSLSSAQNSPDVNSSAISDAKDIIQESSSAESSENPAQITSSDSVKESSSSSTSTVKNAVITSEINSEVNLNNSADSVIEKLKNTADDIIDDINEATSSSVATEDKAPTIPANNVSTGPKFVENTSGNEALDILLQKAIEGDKEAQYTLGLILQESPDVESQQTACAWFTIAAKSGHPDGTSACSAISADMTEDQKAEINESIEKIESKIQIPPEVAAAEARDNQRRLDVTTIYNAIKAHSKDVGGGYGTALPIQTAKEICKIGSDCGELVDLSYLKKFNYLDTVPSDPLAGSDASTEYIVVLHSDGKLIVGAPLTEKEITPISVSGY